MLARELHELYALQGKCGYDAVNKARFRQLAMRLLRELRKRTDPSADVRYNPAGIACSGDATLHADRFYVQFNADGISSHLGILYRACNGKRDYTGGTNCWFSWDRLTSEGIEGLADVLTRPVSKPGQLGDKLWIQGSIL